MNFFRHIFFPRSQPDAASPTAWLGWAGLTAYFPLLLWTIPATAGTAGLALRVGLFHGGGTLWSLLVLWREGRLAAISRLTARPGQGVALGVLGFLLLAGVATALLRLPSGTLPTWLPGLLHPLDLSPLPSDPRLPTDTGAVLRLALLMGGGALEEWIFRCALWLRWAGLPGAEGKFTLTHARKLLAVSAYFALLHSAQGSQAMLYAFFGSMVLGGVLARSRNLWLIATLHALYNWNTL